MAGNDNLHNSKNDKADEFYLGNNLRTKVYPKQFQIDKKGKTLVTKLNDGAAFKINTPVTARDIYYEVNGEYYTAIYTRILIRKKCGGEK